MQRLLQAIFFIKNKQSHLSHGPMIKIISVLSYPSPDEGCWGIRNILPHVQRRNQGYLTVFLQSFPLKSSHQ